MTKVQVDRGAIPFVLKGSNIMCPGLTSKGGKLEEDFTENTPVAIMAEGKEHALGVGLTKMSRQEIIDTNNGIGLINVHCLDGMIILNILFRLYLHKFIHKRWFMEFRNCRLN